jgi:PEP-CTERM motif
MLKKIILVTATAAALAAPAAASTVTMASRFNTVTQAFNTADEYRAHIDALVAQPATQGYGTANLNLFENISNGGQFGGSQNSAYRFTIGFSAPAAGQWAFRFGVDFGLGGAMFVNNTALAFSRNDLWWAGNWSSGGVLYGTANLGAGNQQLTLYGLENCCDGQMNGQYLAPGSSVWRSFGANDGLAAPASVPEPGTIGLLLGGLGLVAFARRRKRG